ncbi:hypothetical protein J6590_069585 [Homalodisca vitripennis]|nr:hypothetical protein J6590_069585 [Homalodisca vitripennis]
MVQHQKKNLDKLLKLQKKGIRIMVSLKNNDSVKEYFTKLELLTVYRMYIYETILIVKTDSSVINDIHPHNTRWKNTIITEHHRLELYKKKPNYIKKVFLRRLHENILKENDINIFKAKLKKVYYKP